MATLKASCDVCKRIIEGHVFEDYDGVQRCRRCYLEAELYFEEGQYKNKINWLKETHIEDLKEMKKRIVTLKKELETL